MSATRDTVLAATLLVVASTCAQAPFDLDQGFATTIQNGGVSSIAILEDGDLLLSGSILFPGDIGARSTARLNVDGTRDPSFPQYTYGGGKLVPWEGRFYVGNGQGIRRLWPDGSADVGFSGLDLDPFLHLLQGGDYHVFPDGRLLITGTHGLSDSIRGFVGLYNLIWITADGQLDTTRIHRRGNGDLDTVIELPDGKFLIGGGLTEYEGHPVGDIIRVHPDGALDTTFHTTCEWFWPFTFLPLANGKILCGGTMRFAGIPDTLNVVRLLENGELDPSFNNATEYVGTFNTGDAAGVQSITPLGPDRYIVTGYFDYVEGEHRGGIALIDTAGHLVDDLFSQGGCGTFWDGFGMEGGINGMVASPNGGLYIHGSYHGYDDGTTNDASQRMVSRLYGLDVGVAEQRPAQGVQLHLYPNPAGNSVTVECDLPGSSTGAAIEIMDITGRSVSRTALNTARGQTVLDTRNLAVGNYTVRLVSSGAVLATANLQVKE